MMAEAESIKTQKRILFVRHGITEMNEVLSKHKWGAKSFVEAVGMRDTVLSSSGVIHANNVNKLIHTITPIALNEIELVVATGLTRTLQTAERIWDGTHVMTEPSLKRMVQPLLAERLYLSSDQGRTREMLEAEFPAWDFENLAHNEEWWYNHDPETHGEYDEWRPPGTYYCQAEPDDVFKARMIKAKEWLLARPESTIAGRYRGEEEQQITDPLLFNSRSKTVRRTAFLFKRSLIRRTIYPSNHRQTRAWRLIG